MNKIISWCTKNQKSIFITTCYIVSMLFVYFVCIQEIKFPQTPLWLVTFAVSLFSLFVSTVMTAIYVTNLLLFTLGYFFVNDRK